MERGEFGAKIYHYAMQQLVSAAHYNHNMLFFGKTKLRFFSWKIEGEREGKENTNKKIVSDRDMDMGDPNRPHLTGNEVSSTIFDKKMEEKEQEHTYISVGYNC